MYKKLLSILLALTMLAGPSVTVFADEGEQAPDEPAPAADVTAEDAVVEDAFTEETPAGEEAFAEETPAGEEDPGAGIMPASADSVTLNITGPTEGIQRIIYPGMDGQTYFSQNDGTFYNTLNSSGENEAIYVERSSGLPTQLAVKPGENVRVFMDAEYELSVDNGTITDEEISDLYLGDGFFCVTRRVDITAPTSGQMVVNISLTEDTLPKVIPYTFYNEDWDNEIVIGGEYAGSAWEDWDTQPDGSKRRMITTDGDFSVWVAPGYAIEVLKGGYVVRTEAPSGPAASDVPAGSTSYVLHVDLEADEFVVAAVKQGEHFQAPDDAPQTEAATGTFKDVPDKSWYKDIVERAYAAGVVTGVTADAFAPNDTASRAQTVAMLYRQAGSPAAPDAAFTDLTADYYKGAVAWASSVGAVNGVSRQSFAPDAAISREQLAAILYRMAGSPGIWSGGLIANYSDGGAVSTYAQAAMQWALDYGILTGYEDGTLRPHTAATRAEVCAMLMRYRELVGVFPTAPVATPEPEATPVPTPQTVVHTGRNLDNPKLIAPKRDKIDAGLYDSGDDHDKWMQQWSETFWDLDRSGEDILWCREPLTRMRSGPGEDYSIICTIGNAYEVSRLGPDENGWAPVVYHEYDYGGFTGWDYTGYVPAGSLTKTMPRSPHVADFSSGPALDAWCESSGYQTGEFLHTYGGEFYHEQYAPSISGDSYVYTLRGGGQVVIRDVIPEGLRSVEVSAYEQDSPLLVFVYVAFGYGVRCDAAYNGGYGLSPSGNNVDCGLYYSLDLAPGESVEMTMVAGDEAPRVLQVSVKDPLGGSRMSDGGSRFVFLDKDGNFATEYREDFFNLKSGYKLKSLSPYASAGKVEHELHYFNVSGVPKDVDQIWFEVVRS